MASRKSKSNLKRLEDLRRKYKLGEFAPKRAARTGGRSEKGRGRRRVRSRPIGIRPTSTKMGLSPFGI